MGVDRRRFYTQCKLSDIDDMKKLEPIVVTCLLIAMKFEEKNFIHLADMLKTLKIEIDEKQIHFYEKAILETLKWKIGTHNLYNFWSQHFYIYLTIFQPKMDLATFEKFCTDLLEICVRSVRVYDFSSEIVSLAIVWIVILTNYDNTRDERIMRLAYKALLNKTEEFIECCKWILELYEQEKNIKIQCLESPLNSIWKDILIEKIICEELKLPESPIQLPPPYPKSPSKTSPASQTASTRPSSPSNPCSNPFSNPYSKPTPKCPFKYLSNPLNRKTSILSLKKQRGYRCSSSAFTSSSVQGYVKGNMLRDKQVLSN